MKTIIQQIVIVGFYALSVLHFIFGTPSEGFLAFIAATAFRIAIAMEDK